MEERNSKPPGVADAESPPAASSDVTLLLEAWRDGDAEARDELLSVVYAHLRELAQHHARREHGSRTLQPTALVHEAYLRLIDADVDWHSRAHFFAVAGRTMRRVLVDEARRRARLKRGGERPLCLDDLSSDPATEEVGMLELNDALTRLEQLDPRKAEILEARVFSGLTIQESSEVLGFSTATIERELRLARAWLARELMSDGS